MVSNTYTSDYESAGGECNLANEHSSSINNQGKSKEFVIKKMTRNPSNQMLPKTAGLINIYNINNGAAKPQVEVNNKTKPSDGNFRAS